MRKHHKDATHFTNQFDYKIVNGVWYCFHNGEWVKSQLPIKAMKNLRRIDRQSGGKINTDPCIVIGEYQDLTFNYPTDGSSLPLNPLGTFGDPEENPNGTGLKYDAEKPMYNLIPPVAINSLAEVMTFGARKYQPNSWQNVENGLERYRAALLRHVFAIQRGEIVDPESGLNHSAHALACAAFINELEHMESK